MSTRQQNKATAQDFLEIFDITNDLVILKDGTTCFLLMVGAMNFGLLAEAEQDAVIYTYAALLNSLNYPIQIVIQSQTKDVTNYLNLLKQKEEESASPQKRERIARYRGFVSNLIQERNVLDKNFYVAVPATPLELGLLTVDSVIPGKTEFDISKHEKPLIVDKAQSVLEPRRDHLISQFARIGLYSRQLTTQEIIRVFYTNYNPEASEGFGVADSREYQTALVSANIAQQAGQQQQPQQLHQPEQLEQQQLEQQSPHQEMAQVAHEDMNQWSQTDNQQFINSQPAEQQPPPESISPTVSETQLAGTTQVTQPTQPIESTPPTEPTQPTQPVEPIEPAQPTQPIQPTQSVEPAQPEPITPPVPPEPTQEAVNSASNSISSPAGETATDQVPTQPPTSFQESVADFNPPPIEPAPIESTTQQSSAQPPTAQTKPTSQNPAQQPNELQTQINGELKKVGAEVIQSEVAQSKVIQSPDAETAKPLTTTQVPTPEPTPQPAPSTQPKDNEPGSSGASNADMIQPPPIAEIE